MHALRIGIQEQELHRGTSRRFAEPVDEPLLHPLHDHAGDVADADDQRGTESLINGNLGSIDMLHFLLAAAAHLDGEYDLRGLYIGVPVIIGKAGVEKIVEIELTQAEKTALHESADRVRGLLALL